MCLATTRELMDNDLEARAARALRAPDEAAAAAFAAPGSALALSEDVRVIKNATWLALRVRNGDEALRLLLRSDRAYVDLQQHELFLKGDEDDKRKAFNMQVGQMSGKPAL